MCLQPTSAISLNYDVIIKYAIPQYFDTHKFSFFSFKVRKEQKDHFDLRIKSRQAFINMKCCFSKTRNIS